MEFAVAPEKGLAGFCDFLLTAKPSQIDIEAPVLAVVEAKNDNIRSGIPQCVAEMVAAREFNLARSGATGPVFGAVTTGSLWTFLRLQETQVEVDPEEYYLREIDRVVGVMVEEARPPR